MLRHLTTRNFQLALLCLICVTSSYAQTATKSYGRVDVEIIKEKKPKKIYTKVEIKSAFTGGDSSWIQSLEKTLNQSIQYKNGTKAGKYIVSILDAQNCTLKDTTDITTPAAITATKTVTNVNCFGQNTGSVTLTPAGGTAPFSYSWSSGETTKDITNKAAGRYIVTILDAKNCSIKDTSDITQPVAAIALSQVVTNVACNGASTGAINLTVVGGTPAFSYSWTGANGFTASIEDITNLRAGGYSVTVTDSKGCAQTLGPITVSESAAMTVIPIVTNSTCGQTNGAISITPAVKLLIFWVVAL